MNYCTKCGSIYTQPGTCNCFAPQPMQPVPTVVPLPLPYPTPTWVPWNPYPGTGITWTCGPNGFTVTAASAGENVVYAAPPMPAAIPARCYPTVVAE